MRDKLALLTVGAVIGYLGKKIYDKSQTSSPNPQYAARDYSAEDKSNNREEAAKPKSELIPDPTLITEPASVAALKRIYESNGSGDLDWDFSVADQALVKDGRVEAHEGALISLNLSGVSLYGILKLCDVETLAVLKAAHCNLEGIDLKNLPSLKVLTLYGNDIVDISALACLTSLTELDIAGNYSLSEIRPLAGLTSLAKLDMKFSDVNDLSPLAGLTNLTELAVCCLIGDGISDLSPLANLTSLTRLSLEGKGISSLRPLGALTELAELEVRGGACSDLSPLAGMMNLEALHIGCSTLTDISPLRALNNLRKLNVCGCAISDLGPLSDLSNLRELDVSWNEIIDLSPLSGLSKLTKLTIDHNRIRDFRPLGELKKLVSESAFTGQRKETKAEMEAAAKSKAYARKIGKCPHCKRIIRYLDIEAWEPYRWSHLWLYCSAPIYRKTGKCPDCGQSITVEGMGSSLIGMPFYAYPWEIVVEGRPTSFERLASLFFPGSSNWLGGVVRQLRFLLQR